LFSSLVFLLTLPYHRFFTYNTLLPAREIAKHASSGGADNPSSPDREHLYAIILSWRARKKDELSFAALAATVITAIVTASFSWGNVEASVWVGPAFWYASLSTSICGIFLSAQQVSVLSLMGDLPTEESGGTNKKKKKKVWEKASARLMRRHLAQIVYEVPVQSSREEEHGTESADWKISWRSIFTWQCPMMFIAYSTLFYIVGLSVVVLTPLIKEDWGENSYVAVAYAASTGLAWGLFAFCSLGGYSEISLHQREEDEEEEEEDRERRPDDGSDGK
ncbi:hypothetical protein V8F33_008351, partial [Rhypophila sp. PSN 637]